MASLSASAERIAKKSSEDSETSVSSTASIIDASNPFRLGFPAPLPALPVGHSSCDEKFPVSYDDIIREVTSLLKRRDISWGSVVVVSRRASATVSDKRPTILVTATAVKDDSCLRGDLRSRRLEDSCPFSHRTRTSDCISLAEAPERYHHGSSPSMLVQLVGVTIIITSKYPSELSHTKRTIQLRCQQYNLDRIEVCFVQVDTIFAAGGFRSPDEGRDFAVTSDLFSGASIGLSSEPRATASFGGKLIVRRGIEINELGVTNFHVVASHQSLHGLTLSRQNQGDRLTPDHAASLNVGLVSPSNFDANFKREIVENALDLVRRDVEKLQEQRRTEYLNGKQERALSKLQAGMDAVNLEAQALNNLNKATGTVWAGSGFRSSNDFGMDWALVSLPSSRSFLNKLPTSEELAALPPYIHPTLLFPDSGKVEECGPCEKGAIVFERGRTTGLTPGTLSHVDTTVNFNGRTVSAWLVIGTNNLPFCDSCDSRSWLIDRNGKWVGLLFACPFPSYTGDGYAIPALELIKDIEALVGGRCSLGFGSSRSSGPVCQVQNFFRFLARNARQLLNSKLARAHARIEWDWKRSPQYPPTGNVLGSSGVDAAYGRGMFHGGLKNILSEQSVLRPVSSLQSARHSLTSFEGTWSVWMRWMRWMCWTALIGPGRNYITRIGGASPRRLHRRHDNDADNEDSTSIILIP
ncbi:conserved hypothetical protein [Histoplasma capsulatum H143]|uniref:Uncharacterized protein n=1 Tax=Ajellomyces capsulatus (strain H143) TaxID=544712 RepID=C6H6A9_AJECH|nr:conserved hypothetical protein [Histoplasma capsulatum H143]